LSFSANNVADVPLLRDVSASFTEQRGPSRLSKLQVESGRLGFSSFALVEGFVHPDFLDAARYFSRHTLAKVLSSLAFSTGHESVGAVGERGSEVAPDGAVSLFRLVARSEGSQLAVSRSGSSRNDRGLGVEFTSHGAVEAANLLSDNNFSFDGGGSLSQATGAEVELEEVSLGLRVVSDS